VRQGGAIVPEKQLSAKEATPLLRALRLYPWGSYRAYAGYARIPEWLTTETIFERAGVRDHKKAYRKAVQERLTGGVESELMEQLRDATAVGSAEFSAQVRKAVRQSGREIAARYRTRGAVAFPLVIKAVERHIGESVVPGKRGGLGRDMAFKLARDLCGLTLRELGVQMGGVDYASVHMAIGVSNKKWLIIPILTRRST
jgi:hypothetical protein